MQIQVNIGIDQIIDAVKRMPEKDINKQLITLKKLCLQKACSKKDDQIPPHME